jgi:hypothetical protein
MTKAIIDKFLQLTISKKLTVFVIATIFVFLDKISPNDWINIAIIYIGTQGVIDAIIKIRK